MFGTLRLNSGAEKTPEFIQQAQSIEIQQSGGAYVFSHIACDQCRSKKLRCSGQKSGCDRCKTVKNRCTYENGGKNRAHHKSSSQSQRATPVQGRYRSESSSTSSRERGMLSQEERRQSYDGQSLQRNNSSQLPSPTDSETISALDFMQQFSDNSQNNDKLTLQRLLNSFPDLNDTDMMLDDLDQTLQHQANGLETSNEFSDSMFFLGPENSMGPSQSPLSMMEFSPGSSLETPPTAHSSLAGSTTALADTATSGFMGSPQCGKPRHEQFQKIRQPSRPSSLPNFDLSLSMEPPKRDSDGCLCLAQMLRLLEEMESRSTAVNVTMIDKTLAWHKKALSHGTEMLSCVQCRDRSDYMSLQAVVADKLAVLSEQIVSIFIRYVRGQPSAGDGSKQSNADRSCDTQGPAGMDDWCRKRSIQMGEFEVKTHGERAYVLGALIQLQLKELDQHVRRMCGRSMHCGRNAQVQMLQRIDKRLMDLYAETQAAALSCGGLGTPDERMDEFRV